jgi:hypothetical protein
VTVGLLKLTARKELPLLSGGGGGHDALHGYRTGQHGKNSAHPDDGTLVEVEFQRHSWPAGLPFEGDHLDNEIETDRGAVDRLRARQFEGRRKGLKHHVVRPDIHGGRVYGLLEHEPGDFENYVITSGVKHKRGFPFWSIGLRFLFSDCRSSSPVQRDCVLEVSKCFEALGKVVFPNVYWIKV